MPLHGFDIGVLQKNSFFFVPAEKYVSIGCIGIIFRAVEPEFDGCPGGFADMEKNRLSVMENHGYNLMPVVNDALSIKMFRIGFLSKHFKASHDGNSFHWRPLSVNA